MPIANSMLPRVLVVLSACVTVLALAPSASAVRPLETGMADGGPFNVALEIPNAYKKVRATGASAIRLYVIWRNIAPAGAEKPAGFDPADPADPAYDWSLLDYQVYYALQNDLEPILSIEAAPDWAEGDGSGPFPGTFDPSAREFGLFATAAAQRYSGSFNNLPRVRYWQAWNEPNYFRHLMPQYNTAFSDPVGANSRLLSPGVYRGLLNAFARSVHRVHRDNLVITGGLAPFGNERAETHVSRTLPFMRALLCMNARNRPEPGCNKRSHFDVWSHHPYTSGGPTHHAASSEDVSMGDLEKMSRLLNAAIRAGHIVSRQRPKFWITEFSWDTKPPDPGAVPMKIHKRWVAHALYRAWKNGVSLFTWFQLRDAEAPIEGEHTFESGLYFRCKDGSGRIACLRPKPSRQAFRFPFVAFRSGEHKARVWGRTPWGLPGQVAVEQRRKSGWRRLAELRANRAGIFKRTLRVGSGDLMRAKLVGPDGGEKSVPFSLTPVPDFSVNPFG